MNSLQLSCCSLALALVAQFGATVDASLISINVTDDGPGAGPASSTNTAGAVLAGNWNTIGTDGQGLSGTDTTNLLNASGANSGVAVTQSADQAGFFHASSGFSGTIGDKVMENFTDTGSNYSYTFTGLNAGVGAEYDVYIYTARNFDNTGVSQFDVNGQTLFLTNESSTGDYQESGFASQALAEANLNAGNYVRFQGINLDTLTIGVTALTDTTNGGFLAAVNAIQIVAVPEPSTSLIAGLVAFMGAAVIRQRRFLGVL